MDVRECIAGRRSVRKFLDLPVETEKLGYIIDAMRDAPSAGNLQDTRCIVITDKEAREAVAKACLEQQWISNAPLVLVVCGQQEKTKQFYDSQGEKYSIQNGAAAIQNMLLTIHDQGLASCWVGAFEEEMLRRTLSIPDKVLIHGVLPVGYPDEHPLKPVRYEIYDVTFLGTWGNKVKDMAAYMQWYGEHVQKALKKGKEFVKKAIEKLS